MFESVDTIYKSVVAGCVMVIAYFTRQVVEDVKQTKKELDAHKLHVSETYAKDVNIQQSLSRLHDRIDDTGKDIKAIHNILLTMKK